MIYVILKYVAYMLAWILPVIILVVASRFMRSKSIASTSRRLILAGLVLLVWIIGLVCSWLGQSFHEAAWMASHPEGIRTEEDMMAVGDYPNITAGWIFLGWLPLGVGLLLSRWFRSDRKA